MITYLRRYSLLLLLALGLGASSAAMAAPGGAEPLAGTGAALDSQLDEIVVSARKRDERLIDIPESISVISAESLLRQGIQTVEDIGRQTPNFQLNMRQDLTTNVVIRGTGAYGDVLGVGFNVDNVPNFTDQTMRLEDVESVEILKGPQGTLYGGSSIGGLVRYVSKKPSFNWEGEASLEVGSYSRINVSASQNFPLIDGKLALRLSGYDVKEDGYIKNPILGINADPLEDWGVRAQALYKPTDSIEALLTLRHSFIQNGGDMYLPVPSVKNYTYDALFFQPAYNRRITNGAVLEVNADTAIGKLTSIASYTVADNSVNVDISQTPPGIPGESYFTLPNNRPTEVETQELRLTSPSTGNFKWLFGAYGAIIKNTLLNELAAIFVPTPGVIKLYDFDVRRTDTALFGTASYKLGQVTLDAGARLTRTVYDANIFIEAGGAPNQHNSITSQAVLPKFSVSYAFSNDQQVYATVAKGEEPGAVNTVSTAPIPYKSETALSYELGAKGQALNRKFEYALAAFYINNKDHQYQTNQYIPALGGFVAAISNIGDSHNYGVEASATWQPNSEWRFGVTGGYLNARWTHANFFGTPIDGNWVPNAPEYTASFSAGYTRPVRGNLRFDANFDLSYTDAMWWDLPNTPGTKEPPHFLGDLRVALGSDHRGWQVALRVSNLFGAKYWTEYFPAFFPAGSYPCPGCTDMGAPGAPRYVFGSITFKY